jgi:hypothetical protein
MKRILIVGIGAAMILAALVRLSVAQSVAKMGNVDRSTSVVDSINSQGTTGAPIAVSTAVATVIPYMSGRHGYSVQPETVSIRCVKCVTVPCSPAPSATVGFLIASGQTYLEQTNPWLALQCFSTGASTSVDTDEAN